MSRNVLWAIEQFTNGKRGRWVIYKALYSKTHAMATMGFIIERYRL